MKEHLNVYVSQNLKSLFHIPKLYLSKVKHMRYRSKIQDKYALSYLSVLISLSSQVSGNMHSLSLKFILKAKPNCFSAKLGDLTWQTSFNQSNQIVKFSNWFNQIFHMSNQPNLNSSLFFFLNSFHRMSSLKLELVTYWSQKRFFKHCRIWSVLISRS